MIERTTIKFTISIFISILFLTSQNIKAQTEEIQQQWIQALNNSQSLEPFYNQNSGIYQQNRLFTKMDEISKRWINFQDQEGSITVYKILDTFQLRENQKFELGWYKTEKGSTYYTIIGWRNKDRWIKEVEVTYAANNPRQDKAGEIDPFRMAWEKYSNDHKPDLIGTELYLDGGYYFNRGRAFTNKEISDAYSYMYDESYNITLETLNTTFVTDNLAFDIGTYQTRGKGLYILIWKKVKDEWKLLLDFNF